MAGNTVAWRIRSGRDRRVKTEESERSNYKLSRSSKGLMLHQLHNINNLLAIRHETDFAWKLKVSNANILSIKAPSRPQQQAVGV